MTTDGPGLLAKADRYLQSPRLLIEAGDFDSAVSRLYYAAFYLAEVLLDVRGFSFSSHKAVISAFGRELVRSGHVDARFHRLLITTFEKRQEADYWAETDLNADDVRVIVAEVEQFLSETRRMLSKAP